MAKSENATPTPDTAIALPPKPLAERLRLSQRQQQIVSELSVAYLQRNKVPFNKPNLQAALAVLGIDSLQRGLLLEGRDEVTAKDNVRTLIRTGLQQRTDIQTQAAQVLDENLDRARLSEQDYIGPLVLRRSTILGAAQEQRNFYVSPTIPNSEEVTYLAQARRTMLPQIAELAVGTLPHEQYPQATIDQFPRQEDQAAIVRNMVTSLIFRGNPLPVISIEELIQFANHLDLQALFQPELAQQTAKAIAGRLQLPEEDVASYISGLRAQVKDAFIAYATTGHPNMKQEDREAIRDQMYRAFRGTLLLLHPALEEQPLITDPVKAQAAHGEHSLWTPEISTVIASLRMPTMDGLYRAIRLAGARGYISERFTQAISAWHSLRIGQKREAGQIDRLRSEIQSLGQELEIIQDPAAKLPNVAEWIMRTFQRDDWLAFVDARGHLAKNENIVNQARDLRARTYGYIDELKSENDGELPEEAPVPEWILEERRGYEAGRPRSIVAQAQGRIERAIENLREDFLTQYNPNFEDVVSSIDSRSVDEIKSLSDQTRLEIERVEKDKPQTVSIGADVNVAQVLQYIDMLLEGYIASNPRQSTRSPYWRRQIELAKVRKIIEGKQTAGMYKDSKGVPREFYLFCMNRRKKAFDDIVYSRRKIEDVPEVAEVPLIWQKADIEQWVKEVEVATLPDDMPTDFIAQNVIELDEWWKKFTTGMTYGLSWPKTVPDRGDFIVWARETISAKARRIVRGPSPDQRKHWGRSEEVLQNNIRLLSEFVRIIDNPLFPREAAEGLNTRDFWSLFAKRMQLANARINVGAVRLSAETQAEAFNAKQRKYYKEYVERKKQRLEKEIANIESSQAALTKFIEQMRSLNLVIQEPTIEQPDQIS